MKRRETEAAEPKKEGGRKEEREREARTEKEDRSAAGSE